MFRIDAACVRVRGHMLDHRLPASSQHPNNLLAWLICEQLPRFVARSSSRSTLRRQTHLPHERAFLYRWLLKMLSVCCDRCAAKAPTKVCLCDDDSLSCCSKSLEKERCHERRSQQNQNEQNFATHVNSVLRLNVQQWPYCVSDVWNISRHERNSLFQRHFMIISSHDDCSNSIISPMLKRFSVAIWSSTSKSRSEYTISSTKPFAWCNIDRIVSCRTLRGSILMKEKSSIQSTHETVYNQFHSTYSDCISWTAWA